jgi:hypothetical protein
MTRKDYQLIASVLKNYATEGIPVDDRDAIAYDLADALASDNPRFNRDRFLVAAGVYEKCDSCEARATSFSTSMQWCQAHKGKGLVSSSSMQEHWQNYAAGNSFPAW